MLIMKCLFGSHLYGLQTANSDKDYKGIYLPTQRELLLGNYRKHYSESTGNDRTKNTKDDVDVEIFSLPYFIELACKGETVAIDMLHADNIHLGPLNMIWSSLRAQRRAFYTKDMKSYVGYARKQANKYGIKGSRIAAVENVHLLVAMDINGKLGDIAGVLPVNEFCRFIDTEDRWTKKLTHYYEVCGRKLALNLPLSAVKGHLDHILASYGERAQQAKTNQGVDWKAVSHALRASYQMLDILTKGDFEYPLDQSTFLLRVKVGQLDFVNDVQPELDRVIEEIERLAPLSNLPEKVDRDFWDEWLLDVYKSY